MCWWSPQLQKDAVIDSMTFKFIFISNLSIRKGPTIMEMQCTSFNV
jgi:hypothetical protein